MAYTALGSSIWANRIAVHTGRPVSAAHSPHRHYHEGGGLQCVTPRQTCPRPKGLGRNLRSKTRWFTGFCNSHQVSHFATFFIDARAEISVAGSHFRFVSTLDPQRPHFWVHGANILCDQVPWRSPRRGLVMTATRANRGGNGA